MMHRKPLHPQMLTKSKNSNPIAMINAPSSVDPRQIPPPSPCRAQVLLVFFPVSAVNSANQPLGQLLESTRDQSVSLQCEGGGGRVGHLIHRCQDKAQQQRGLREENAHSGTREHRRSQWALIGHQTRAECR